MSKVREPNHSSSLLSKEENELIFHLIGDRNSVQLNTMVLLDISAYKRDFRV